VIHAFAFRPLAAALAASALVALPAVARAQHTFDGDVAFLRQKLEVVVLGEDGGARVAVVPAWQGRVATSTVGGASAPSYGWINRELAGSGKLLPHMNAFGGEDRVWLGPEGGQYSIFFKKGDPFDLEHWQTPPLVDSQPWTAAAKSAREVSFRRDGQLVNYSGTRFDFRLERAVRLLAREDAAKMLGEALPATLHVVAFESENSLVNTGSAAWTQSGGLLSIWILGMFQPTPGTTIVVPYRQGPESELGPIVNDAYFGKVPAERLQIKDLTIRFRGDGQYRSKIGLSPQRALDVALSYDASAHVLTLVQFTRPQGARDYVNSMWETQKEPYRGDVLNSYNDGPLAPGKPGLGPFYELESSSPALRLAPGEHYQHVHRTFHFRGSDAALDAIARSRLRVGLADIAATFKH